MATAPTPPFEPASSNPGATTKSAALDPSYDEVEVFVGSAPTATAKVTAAALLEAAEDLGLPAQVVRFDPGEGKFVVPAAVAAGVDVTDPLNPSDQVTPVRNSKTQRAKVLS